MNYLNVAVFLKTRRSIDAAELTLRDIRMWIWGENERPALELYPFNNRKTIQV